MLTAFIDLALTPPTYDVVAALGTIDVWGRRWPDEIVRVVFIPGPREGFMENDWPPATAVERRAMLHKVAMPMARMLPGAVVSYASDREQAIEAAKDGPSIGLIDRLWTLPKQLESLKQGSRPLRPSGEPQPRNDKLVTITLRESRHWPTRNSNLAQWLIAASKIADQGFDVVAIRDTAKADERFAGFATSTAAALDLDVRARLYRSAMCNLFTSGGPGWFAVSLDAPVLMFKLACERAGNMTKAGYFQDIGFPVGSQLPTAPKHQRLVWEEDTAGTILSAFNDFRLAQTQRFDQAVAAL